MVSSKFIMESAPGAITRINGRDYLYFGGTSYYSLHNHPAVVKAAGNALEKYGMLSATTRLGYGTTALLETLEKKVSEYFGTEDAAYLASGFLSGMAGVQALDKHEGFDLIFLDNLSHYSNRNAAFSVEKPVFTFAHLSIEDLRSRLMEYVQPGQKPLVISDGVFPVFGEIAPIEKYLELLEPYNGILWIDEPMEWEYWVSRAGEYLNWQVFNRIEFTQEVLFQKLLAGLEELFRDPKSIFQR